MPSTTELSEAAIRGQRRRTGKAQRQARKIQRGGKPIARRARSDRRQRNRQRASVAARSAWAAGERA